MFSLVSLMVVGAIAAYYFTVAQPVVSQPGQYQRIEAKANAAAAMMTTDPQAQVDAASGGSTPPITNAPPAGQ